MCEPDGIDGDGTHTPADPKRGLDTPNYNGAQLQSAEGPAVRDFDQADFMDQDNGGYSHLQSEDTQRNPIVPYPGGPTSNCFEFKDQSSKSLEEYDFVNQPE